MLPTQTYFPASVAPPLSVTSASVSYGRDPFPRGGLCFLCQPRPRLFCKVDRLAPSLIGCDFHHGLQPQEPHRLRRKSLCAIVSFTKTSLTNRSTHSSELVLSLSESDIGNDGLCDSDMAFEQTAYRYVSWNLSPSSRWKALEKREMVAQNNPTSCLRKQLVIRSMQVTTRSFPRQ